MSRNPESPESKPPTKDGCNEYTMLFAFTPEFQDVLLLRKPADHRNPIFRGKWTAPGGVIEEGESEIECVIREMREETGLSFASGDVRTVLFFPCNCDPEESEHTVIVYTTIADWVKLKKAFGTRAEPVELWPMRSLNGLNTVPYVEHLIALSIQRLNQPVFEVTR